MALLFWVFFSLFFFPIKDFSPGNILSSAFIFSIPYLLETQTDFSIACRAIFERRIWGQTQRRADLTVSSPRVRKFQGVPWNITTCVKCLCAASGWSTTSPYLTLIFDINVHWCSLGVPHKNMKLLVFCFLFIFLTAFFTQWGTIIWPLWSNTMTVLVTSN